MSASQASQASQVSQANRSQASQVSQALAAEPGARVVVVGGGLAGLAAGLVAADAGARVTVLEARPRLGGATASFAREGMWVDTGQHVFMRCCVAYRAFLRRLDVEHLTTLQSRLDVGVQLADTGERARLRRTRLRLPAPLHLTPALLGYGALPMGQRLRAALAAFQLGRLDPADPGVDGRSFGSWLAAHGQRPRATEALWELLTVATLNATAANASLGLAAKVVQTGLLESADAGDLGWSDVPLQRLHGDAAAAALAAAGAVVRTGVKVRGLRPPTPAGPDGPAGWLVLTDDGQVEADAVILAVPPAATAALLPPGAIDEPDRLTELGVSPIVNVHMIYDRPVLDEPFLAAVGSPVQWIFDRTASSGLRASEVVGPAGPLPEGAQYVAISLSAAEEWIKRPAGEIREIFVAEMRRLLPAARDAQVIEVFVTREATATFQQAPGSLRLRPGPATALPGLAIAGAWTDTGWPATMEGAVRSGLAAAKQALPGGIAAAPARASRRAASRANTSPPTSVPPTSVISPNRGVPA